jgi:WD40 repeat protein
MGAVRWLRRLQYLAAALAVTMAAVPVRAQTDDSPSGPMLRINAPGHTAPIRGIATDAAERFAVTASDDKTVRVWSLPDGKLQRVICLPSGTGDFGKAYAVALSPDGSTIAVGGSTAPPGYNGNIYLFARASGALVQRLPGLPNVVMHLEFSPDGKRLAAAVWGANGIRVFDVANRYQLLPSDRDYGASSYWADFDRTNRLVSASFDGLVRIYAADRYDRPAVPKTKVPGIARPASVAFSPDRKHIAVGDHDTAAVVVLRDHDLKPVTFPTVSGLDAMQIKVAWSSDGL